MSITEIFFKEQPTIGYIATPKFIYYPTSNFRIEAGVRLQKYSGLSSFSESDPVFSIHYQANDKLSLILGSLKQEDNHHLHESIFDPERFFKDKGENGIQVLYNSKFFKADTWINWEQFIFQDDPLKEVFTSGLSANLRLNKLESKYSLSIPMQLLCVHRGGEVDTSDLKKQTIINVVTGISLKRELSNSRFKSLKFEALILDFNDVTNTKEYGYNHGNAFNLRVGMETNHSSFKIGYWLGDQYSSARGTVMFQSISDFDSSAARKERNLFTAKYRIQKSIVKGILVGGHTDAYFDTSSTGDLFYSVSVFVKINSEFFIKKIRWD